MPVGTKATVKTLHPGRGAGPRRGRDPRQHVPPPLPAGRGRDRGARRPARVHGLGRADPHRLRRLPGLLAAGHAAPRSTTTASRSAPSTTGAAERLTPEAAAEIQAPARLRHRDVPRHLPARRRVAARARGGGAPHPALGGAPGRGAAGGRAAAVRDRAGRRRPRAARPLDRGDRGAAVRRLRARRARGRREPRRDARRGRLGGAALPAERPRYFMGLGDAEGILEVVARGDRHVRLRPADAHRPHRLRAHRDAAGSTSATPASRAIRDRSRTAAGARPARGSRGRSSGTSSTSRSSSGFGS